MLLLFVFGLCMIVVLRWLCKYLVKWFALLAGVVLVL